MSNRLPQKLISFSDNEDEFARVNKEIKDGWSLVSIMPRGSVFLAILEKKQNDNSEQESIYIPPRKKIKISA